MSAGSAHAQSSACPVVNPTYTGNCGPTFVLPGWGDAGGWSDPSQYATIQLADVDGDGRDELLGRSDAGLQIHEFDTTVGRWRPQLVANEVPAVLTDFRSPLPSESSGWMLPQYYSAIQTADIDGQPGEEVMARFYDGVRIYKFTPGAGGAPGSWGMLVDSGLLSDAEGWGSDPSLYSTIQTADVWPAEPGEEILTRARNGIAGWLYQSGGRGTSFLELPVLDSLGTDADGGQQPKYYTDLITGRLASGGVILVRDAAGIHTAQLDDQEDWDILDSSQPAKVFGDQKGPDCPMGGSADCFGSSPSYYETLQLADIDGDKQDELLGRAADGLRVKAWRGPSAGWAELPLATLTDPANGAPGRQRSSERSERSGSAGAAKD